MPRYPPHLVCPLQAFVIYSFFRLIVEVATKHTGAALVDIIRSTWAGVWRPVVSDPCADRAKKHQKTHMRMLGCFKTEFDLCVRQPPCQREVWCV